MLKKHQNPEYLMNNGLLNLNDKFFHTQGYGILFYNVLVLCVWNSEILDELCLRN